MFGRSKDKKPKQDTPPAPRTPALAPEPPQQEATPTEPADEGAPLAPMMRSTDRVPDPGDPAPQPRHAPPAPAEAVIEVEPDDPVSVEDEHPEPAPEPPAPAPSQASLDAAADAASMIQRIQNELSELKQAEEQRDEAVRSHADRERAYTERIETLENELNAERSRREELESSATNEASRVESMEGRVRELESALRGAAERAEETQRERDEAIERAAQPDGEMQSALDAERALRAETESRIEELERTAQEAAQRAEALQRERDEAQAHADGAGEELERLRRERHEACERAARLEQELAEAQSQPSPEHGQDDEARAELAQLQNALTEFESRMQTAESNAEQLSQELASVHERAALSEARVDELTAERDALREAAESATGTSLTNDGFNAVRRERLARVRTALNTRTAQLYKVKQALEHKAKELKDASEVRRRAEQTLFEAKERRAQIERTFEAVMSLRAKGASGLYTACVFVAWVTLCAGAWFGTAMVVPVEHDAQAVLNADLRGLDEPEARAESWNTFAAALPQDPMFLERAAQRMKTRAYEDFDTPSELGSFLTESATFDAHAPGELTVSVRTMGADRSERLLDTISKSIVAYANETRTRRADGAPTAVLTPASASSVPAEDPRTAIAGAVAGGLTAMLLIAAIGAWRALRKTVIESGREALADMNAQAAPAFEPSADADRSPIDGVRPIGAQHNGA